MHKCIMAPHDACIQAQHKLQLTATQPQQAEAEAGRAGRAVLFLVNFSLTTKF